MIRTTEVYSLQGHVGNVIMYDDTSYYISPTNELQELPMEVFRSLLASRALMRCGEIFEKTAKEVVSMYKKNIDDSSIMQAITRPDIDSQALCIGDNVYYLKNTFLTDMPSGTYTFSDGKFGVEIALHRQEVKSYQNCESFVDGESTITYLFRYDNNQYYKMGMK